MALLRPPPLRAQLAVYPDGAAYSRHRDAFPDDGTEEEQRRVTAVVYLNPEWLPSAGGVLRAFLPPAAGGGSRDVEPRGGRLLLFLSGAVDHEVLPACGQERVAISAWCQ